MNYWRWNIADLVNAELLESNPLVYKSAKLAIGNRRKKNYSIKTGLSFRRLKLTVKNSKDKGVIVIAVDITARKRWKPKLRSWPRIKNSAHLQLTINGGRYTLCKMLEIYYMWIKDLREYFWLYPRGVNGTYPTEKIIHPELPGYSKKRMSRYEKEENCRKCTLTKAMGLKKGWNIKLGRVLWQPTFFEEWAKRS